MEVELYLTAGQLKKAYGNQTFQLSAKQLHEEPNITLLLDSRDAKRMNKRKEQDKGFRFSKYELVHEGGSLKQVKRALKKVGRKIGRTAVNMLAQKAQEQGYDTYGLEDVANQAIHSGNQRQLVNSGYNALDVGLDVANQKLDEFNKQQTGSGIKFQKGSKEAKDHMARLRAMRGNGIGKELKKFGRSSVGKNLKSIGKSALKTGVTVALPALATALAGPEAGIVASSFTPIVNKKIDGLGIRRPVDAGINTILPVQNRVRIGKGFQPY